MGEGKGYYMLEYILATSTCRSTCTGNHDDSSENSYSLDGVDLSYKVDRYIWSKPDATFTALL